TQNILELYAQIPDQDPQRRMIRAEARFAIAHEMALDPLDFFIRRTGRMYFDIESVRAYRGAVMEEFQQAFKYDGKSMESMERALVLLYFFNRRPGRLYFNIESVRAYGGAIMEEFQRAFKYEAKPMESMGGARDASLLEHSDFAGDGG